MAENLDSVIERIKKLLSYQNDKSTDSIAEFENAMAKVQSLLLKYNLSMEDIKEKSLYERSQFCLKIRKTDGQWKHCLVNMLSNHHLVKAIYISRTDKFALIGKDYNIKIVEYLIPVSIQIIENLCSKAYKLYEGSIKPNKFYRDYCMGAQLGLNRRLEEEASKLKKEAGITSIILREESAIQEIMEELFPGAKEHSRKVSRNSATTQGFLDGKNITLRKGIGSSSSAEKALGLKTNLLPE